MDNFPLDALVENIRKKTFRHVEGMFEVLKEIASGNGGPRTLILESTGTREQLTETYHGLKPDLKSLLMLGVLYHDITKPLKAVGHAARAARILEPLDFERDIKDTDVVRDMGGWRDDVTEADASLLLHCLVKYHETLGNFFTGEQSPLGFLPLLRRLPADLRADFTNVLVLLTVAEVGSYGDRGYLAQRKYDRYDRARDLINRVEAGDRQKCKHELLTHSITDPEPIERLIGLFYAFVDKIDEQYGPFKGSVHRAVVSAETEKSITDTFNKDFARIAKLSYALEWFTKLSGGTGAPKGMEELLVVIRLLSSFCRVVNGFPEDTLFELVFPPNPTSDVLDRACASLKESLEASTPAEVPSAAQLSADCSSVGLWNDLVELIFVRYNEDGVAVIEVKIRT